MHMGTCPHVHNVTGSRVHFSPENTPSQFFGMMRGETFFAMRNQTCPIMHHSRGQSRRRWQVKMQKCKSQNRGDHRGWRQSAEPDHACESRIPNPESRTPHPDPRLHQQLSMYHGGAANRWEPANCGENKRGRGLVLRKQADRRGRQCGRPKEPGDGAGHKGRGAGRPQGPGLPAR